MSRENSIKDYFFDDHFVNAHNFLSRLFIETVKKKFISATLGC